MGHVSTKQELIAILRRFDMDGDAKINLKEFQIGMKSSLSIFGNRKGTKRPKSSGGYSIKIVNPLSAKPRKSMVSPKYTHACDVMPTRKSRVKSASRSSMAQRKRSLNNMSGAGQLLRNDSFNSRSRSRRQTSNNLRT